MDTAELEEMLEGGAEAQAVEFKEACRWSTDVFAKHILALANVRDGGYIIVGVSERVKGAFTRESITNEQRDSFRIDEMRDQMTQYADPHVDISVAFPKDSLGNLYAVIRVLQFDEVPVICRKDSSKTTEGSIYYRNRNRRIESAPVSNSYDMREIVMDATVRMMQRMNERGFVVRNADKQKLTDELEGL